MGSHKAINSGNRGRPYGLMLLLAFGTALLGVMVLHKLRERRIFNLLVKEKDREVISLQHLLQTEREHTKQLKRNTEEMKAKIYSLRTQKMELDRKALEMQSTINSLKEEQKTMESALKEEQNEIKMQGKEEETSQLTALKESLKQKEAEIEDLKHRLEHPVVWPVSSDEPSNRSVNLTNTSNMVEKDKSDTILSEGKSEESRKSANFTNGESSTEHEDGSEKRASTASSGEMTVELLQKPQISQGEEFKNGRVVGEKSTDEGLVTKIEYSKEEDVVFGIGERKNIANLTTAIVVNVSELADKDSDVTDGNEQAFARQRQLQKLENSKEEQLEITKDGKKLQLLEARTDAGSRSRGKHGRVGRAKGKLWRILAKNRDSEENRLTSTRSRRAYRPGQDESRSKRESQVSNEGTATEEGEADSIVAELLEARNTADAKLLKNVSVHADPNQQVEPENEMLNNSKYSLEGELRRNKSVDDESTNISSYAEKQNLEQVKQPEEEGRGLNRKMSSRDNYDEENVTKKAKYGNEQQMRDDMAATDMQEQETESSNGDSFRESTSNLEEDKEDYKEEIDELEF